MTEEETISTQTEKKEDTQQQQGQEKGNSKPDEQKKEKDTGNSGSQAEPKPKKEQRIYNKRKPRNSRSKSKSNSRSKPRNSRSFSRGRKNRHPLRGRRNQFKNRRGRLFRAQRAAYYSGKKKGNGKKPFNRGLRRNPRMRKVFVGGLQRSMTSRALYYLFKPEGRLLFAKIVYDKFGYSKGYGLLEFSNPRDAWNVIRKWNGSFYSGLKLRIEYKKFQRRNQNRYKGKRKFSNGGSQLYKKDYGYGKKSMNQGRGNYNKGVGERRKKIERAS